MMLLQTNSYVVPKDKRSEHARLLSRFRQTLARFGCEDFEVFEQAGSNWGAGEPSGRYVQMIRFRDKKHHMAVQAAERTDPAAQKLIAEFCELINFPYQQQQGLFAVGFYNSVLPAGGANRRVKPAMRVVPEMPTGLTSTAGPVAATGAAGAAASAVTADEPVIDDIALPADETEFDIEAELSEPTVPPEPTEQAAHTVDDTDALDLNEHSDLQVDLTGDTDEDGPTENLDLGTIDLEDELSEPSADDANRDVKR
ncbi:MAG TPA: hypothetical protein VGN72_00505 [Tepidisphaeraceae bacterium]|jgi:hypothetical protein|nr:hypothetical protein [Tepidisphaeraceae bacterium]